ncbi:MAG: tetratricopeptide repeat protein [Burkholderiales bacterium]
MPQSPQDRIARAWEALQRGDAATAERLSRQVLDRAPREVPALVLLGTARMLRGQLDSAVTLFTRALGEDPRNAIALEHLGLANLMLSRFADAERILAQALALPRAPATAHMRHGLALLHLGRSGEAVTALNRAVTLDPGNVDARINLAHAFADAGEQGNARSALDAALAIAPNHPDALFNVGVLCLQEGDLAEARRWFGRAIEVAPQHLEAHINLGVAWQSEGKLDQAMAAFREATRIDPQSAQAQFNLGQALNAAGLMAEALTCFRRALDLQPEHPEARWAYTVGQIPAMPESIEHRQEARCAFERELGVLAASLAEHEFEDAYKGVGALQPFLLAYDARNNRDLLGAYGALCTRAMSQWQSRTSPPPGERPRASGKIRVGVVSQHFRNHSVWNAIVKGWFTQLDRDRFELHAFHVGGAEDGETALAKSLATTFAQGPRSLGGWVGEIAARAPDILLYPEVGMDPMTVQLASLRLAPAQAASWGHPETTGLNSIDYYLSAELLEPGNAQAHYVERLVRLPGLGCWNERPATVPADLDPRQLGIQVNEPLFICPGVPFKYAPEHDRVFTDIATRLGRCRFVFFQHTIEHMTQQFRTRLAAQFERAGLDFESHVTFAGWLALPDFLGLLKRADVFLDTIGFSGFNTASHAVQCALPIVTCEGAFMRGRLASGILRRMGLGDLVADSVDDYVARAVKLGADASERSAQRKRIADARSMLYEDRESIQALERFLLEATRSDAHASDS